MKRTLERKLYQGLFVYIIIFTSIKNNIMASITDHVIKLQELTQKNLDILQALNDSFFTNQNHLSVKIGEDQYAIPSFISLENKLNSLTANFKNLVNAPEAGEAFFNFDGNSRAIEVRSYTTTPQSLILNEVTNFNVEQNDIFKDFLTPNPYIQFNLQSLPNDTTQVMVKKIIPLSQELKNIFIAELHKDKNNNNEIEESEKSKSVQYAYKDLYKILHLYQHDIDYIEYDTKMDMPIRKNIGEGTYVIEEILNDYIDENLINYLTIKLRSDLSSKYMSALKYRLFDETIERSLAIGDQLITAEGNAKMEITEIRHNTNTIVVKVLNGEFLNLVPSKQTQEQYIISLSELRFFSPIDFNEDKYIKVPLEEDQYVFVAVAALNSRMNVQSSWGTGIIIDTYSLTMNDIKFQDYYNANVRNVGDVLNEISSMMSNTLSKFTKAEYEEFTLFVPTINPNNLLVTQINKHLNDSIAVQNIRALYSQKKNLQIQLDEIQNSINTINETLASISFDDTTGQRTAYTAQIASLNVRKNEISTSITKIIDEISKAANNSEIPIENAKYRIRGFFDINDIKWADNIKGIRVQYRYKNIDVAQNQALTFNDQFTFSDWNEMEYIDRERIPNYINGLYVSLISPDNSKNNEPSFNQIDIPISQGESVDIKLKLIYDFGYPFVQTSSAWSPIINIEFPDEFLKDVKILDIITENNNDIETNRFKNIIKEEGVPEHIGDKITDQDMIYFHKPENIASGFYTSERRIIPLKDKLEDLNNIITQLKDEVYGSNADSLTVSIKHGSSRIILNPYIDNKIFTESYSIINASATTDTQTNGIYDIQDGLITTVFNLSLCNDSDHVVKLFSMFPGDRGKSLNELINSNKFTRAEFCYSENVGDDKVLHHGVYFEYPVNSNSSSDTNATTDADLQSGNQYLYFRIKDIHTATKFYTENNTDTTLGYTKQTYKYMSGQPLKTSMYLYPKLADKFGLCLDSNIIGSYMLLKPKEEIIIPIIVEYYIDSTDNEKTEIQKTMSFDILPSLYKDAINYKFTIIAKKETSPQDKVINNQQLYRNNSGVYKSIYK